MEELVLVNDKVPQKQGIILHLTTSC